MGDEGIKQFLINLYGFKSNKLIPKSFPDLKILICFGLDFGFGMVWYDLKAHEFVKKLPFWLPVCKIMLHVDSIVPIPASDDLKECYHKGSDFNYFLAFCLCL